MKRAAITLIMFLVGTIYIGVVKAQETTAIDAAPQTSLGVDQAIVEIVLDQDNGASKEVNLFNLTDNSIPIQTTKEGFTTREKASIPADKLDIYDASSWISTSLDETDFIIEPHGIKTVTLKIIKPENATPGGHYATLYFQSLTREDQVKNSTANISIRIAVQVLIIVPGEIVNQIQIKDFSSSALSNNSELTFNLDLVNTGNVHLLPVGKINIYNSANNELITSQDLDTKLILPGFDNNYPIKIDTKSNLSRVFAEVEISYGPENTILKSERVYVNIFPYFFFVLAFLIILLILFRKRIFKAEKILFSKAGDTN